MTVGATSSGAVAVFGEVQVTAMLIVQMAMLAMSHGHSMNTAGYNWYAVDDTRGGGQVGGICRQIWNGRT